MEKSMAVSSNRSPSPITGRPNANPRTPEVNNPIRRSFNGNPFTKPSIVSNPRSFNPMTPANSPSDFGRRNSIDKGVVSSRDYEQKENEKDNILKTVRVRSPAVSKGTKNFMSPTISAASKITTASPRKKVLAERNEPTRASVSFSDGKSPFSSLNLSDVTEETDSKSEMGLNQNKVEATCEMTSANSDHKEAGLGATPISSKASESDAVLNSKVPSTAHDSESVSTVTVEPECVNGHANFKISPSPSCSSCPILAPLDLDPSLPPYDPKKNYLSPRPQFLHYKPNPRIELYLNKERGFDSEEGGKCLEDSFSDTENTEETQSEGSQKESEDASSVEVLKEEEEEEEETHDSEPNLMTKETVEGKGASKPHFLTRSKSISLLLILVIACLSIPITDSPVIGPSSVFKDQTFSKLYDPYEFAKENFDGLARNFRLWSANSISYLSNLFPILRDVDKFGSLHFTNLTALSEDLLVDGYFTVDNSNKGIEEIHQQNELGSIGEGEVEIESLEEKGQPDVGADNEISHKGVEEIHQQNELGSVGEGEVEIESLEEKGQPDIEAQNDTEIEEREHLDIEADDNIEEPSEENRSAEFEELVVHLTLEDEVIEPYSSEVEAIQDHSDAAFHIEIEPQSNIEDQPAIISQASNIQPETSEAGELHGENDLKDQSELDVSDGSSQSLDSLDLPLNGTEDKFLERNMLGISLLVLSLIAATIFTYAKREKTSGSPDAAIPVSQLPAKKSISNLVTASVEHTFQERRSSLNWPTEVDMVGESCPSEMSSFQKSSSCGKRGTNEVQSLERKPRNNSRRESLASSSEYSMGSPSYGSFTTYEIINSKHKGDEETVTPVRRSSRIRKQVTSP